MVDRDDGTEGRNKDSAGEPIRRGDKGCCAACGRVVRGKGYGEGGYVYHNRREAVYMHKALQDF